MKERKPSEVKVRPADISSILLAKMPKIQSRESIFKELLSQKVKKGEGKIRSIFIKK